MLGSKLLAELLLWWWPLLSGSTTQDDFVFNGYSLNNGTTRKVRTSNHDDLWVIDLNLFNTPRNDWWWVLWHFYREKTIILWMTLSADSSILLNELVDDFKKNTRETEWFLEITINGEIRRVKASITGLNFNRKYYQINFIQDIEISFTTIEPFFYKKTEESVTYTWITADFNEEITNNWTVKTEWVFYLIFWTWIVSLTSVSILTWEDTITINETITDSDVLIVDSNNKIVTLNWVEIDYDWVFLDLQVWYNPISFDFNGWSTVNCDITVIYKKKYK